MQTPQSVTAAAAAPAGLPQLPARPAAATAAADAAAKRASAASLAASNASAPSNRSVVNNGPAVKQAAGEIAEAAGLAMADAGVPQTSGQTVKQPLEQLSTNGQADSKPGVQRSPKASPKKAVPAVSAKDVSLKAVNLGRLLSAAHARLLESVIPTGHEGDLFAVSSFTALSSLSLSNVSKGVLHEVKQCNLHGVEHAFRSSKPMISTMNS